ncbi:hypothetical protein ACX93W_17640 [Paenibacillus sp. CAU 1782]
MNTWQGAWYFAKEEFRRGGWRHLMGVFFIFYLLLFLGGYFSSAMKDGELDSFIGWAMDFLAWGLFPLLGLLSSQVKGFYWKTDDYTNKVVGWRILPISNRQVALGRIFLLLMNAIPTLGIFFTLFYLMTTQLYSVPLDLVGYLLFSLFWFSYAIAVAVIYTYIEIGFSGKFYFWFCLIFVVLLLGTSILLSYLVQYSVLVRVYELSRDGQGWISLIALGVAVLAAVVSYNAKIGRIQKRDLYR